MFKNEKNTQIEVLLSLKTCLKLIRVIQVNNFEGCCYMNIFLFAGFDFIDFFPLFLTHMVLKI